MSLYEQVATWRRSGESRLNLVSTIGVRLSTLASALMACIAANGSLSVDLEDKDHRYACQSCYVELGEARQDTN